MAVDEKQVGLVAGLFVLILIIASRLLERVQKYLELVFGHIFGQGERSKRGLAC